MSAIVSLSGGKDSTAMLLKLIEKGIPFDEVIFFDTGWEFPQMYEHLDKLEADTGIEITRLRPDIPFTKLMLENHRTRGKRINNISGFGWPTPLARWCTTRKVNMIERYIKKEYADPIRYIGIAADESHRCKNYSYPLVEWNVTESDALEYCKAHGYDWGGLYDHFDRVSCFCCPLQSIETLRTLRKYHPCEWSQMLTWDYLINTAPDDTQDRFRKDYSLPELEMRFRKEDRQIKSDAGASGID